MKTLIEHVIVEQREFRKETKDALDKMSEKIDEVREFKITSIATARTTAMIVSIICGAITLIATMAMAGVFK